MTTILTYSEDRSVGHSNIGEHYFIL